MKAALINILIVAVAICIFVYFHKSCEELSYEKYFSQKYFGTVERKYLDPESRMQPYIILSNGRKYDLDNEKTYKLIEVGDTLFKLSGSMKFYYVKNGDTTIFYQKCKKREMTDEVISRRVKISDQR